MTDDTVARADPGLEHARHKGGRPPKTRSGIGNTSDAGDARWTVRGVPVNVRGMALKASADRGMTAGDWLIEAITAHARKFSEERAPAQAPPPDLIQVFESKLEASNALARDLDKRLKLLEEAQAKPLLAQIRAKLGV